MKKAVNLADKGLSFQLLKQLYEPVEGDNELEEIDTQREPGAEGARQVDELPPNCS